MLDNRVNTLDTLLGEIETACGNSRSLEENRLAYISFKRRIDCLNETNNEKAREIYWRNKRRLTGEW